MWSTSLHSLGVSVCEANVSDKSCYFMFGTLRTVNDVAVSGCVKRKGRLF